MTPAEVRVLAIMIQNAIKVLYNSSKSEFDQIFGEEMGPYLWHKFTDIYDAKEGDFIGYLDQKRMEQLASYTIHATTKAGGHI